MPSVQFEPKIGPASGGSGVDRAMSTGRLTSKASLDLDLVRGIAALLVLVSHWRFLLFQDFETVSHPNLGLKGFYFITGFGHQAVILFFVLSGYLVGGSVIRSFRRDSWSWKFYLADRGTRLYLVLVPALFLGGLWDGLGIRYFGTGQIYQAQGHFRGIIAQPVSQALTPAVLFGNLGFLQTIATPTFGSNGPLWSLANEFWYYVAFPLAVICFLPRAKASQRALSLFATLAIGFLVGKSIAILFIVWLLGALVASGPIPYPFSRPAAKYLAFIPLLGAMYFERFHPGNEMIGDLVLGLVVTLWIASIVAQSESPVGVSRKVISKNLSAISYSLYLVHLPLLIFLTSILIGSGTQWNPNPIHLAEAFGVLALVLAYAGVAWWLFESRLSAIRKVVYPLVGVARPVPERIAGL